MRYNLSILVTVLVYIVTVFPQSAPSTRPSVVQIGYYEQLNNTLVKTTQSVPRIPSTVSQPLDPVDTTPSRLRRRFMRTDEDVLAEAREILRQNYGRVPDPPISRPGNGPRNWRNWMPQMIEWRRLFGRSSIFYRAQSHEGYPMPSWAQDHVYNMHYQEMLLDGSLPQTLPSSLTLLEPNPAQSPETTTKFDCPICYEPKDTREMARRGCVMSLCYPCHEKVSRANICG